MVYIETLFPSKETLFHGRPYFPCKKPWVRNPRSSRLSKFKSFREGSFLGIPAYPIHAQQLSLPWRPCKSGPAQLQTSFGPQRRLPLRRFAGHGGLRALSPGLLRSGVWYLGGLADVCGRFRPHREAFNQTYCLI